MTTSIKRSIDQWKKDFPQYANLIASTKLEDSAFLDEVLPENFYLPDGLTEIGSNAFSESVIVSDDFNLPSTLQVIAEEAFDNAVLNNKYHWTIPSGIKEITPDSFSQLTYNGTLTFSEGLKIISTGAFTGSEIKVDNLILLPKSLEIVEVGAFEDTVYVYNNKSYNVPEITDVDYLRKWFQHPDQSK